MRLTISHLYYSFFTLELISLRFSVLKTVIFYVMFDIGGVFEMDSTFTGAFLSILERSVSSDLPGAFFSKDLFSAKRLSRFYSFPSLGLLKAETYLDSSSSFLSVLIGLRKSPTSLLIGLTSLLMTGFSAFSLEFVS